MIDISEKCNIEAKQVIERLQLITQSEIDQNIKTQDGEGIIVKVIAKNNKTIRVTTYYEISDIDMNYTIKKMSFVFKEMECNLAPRGFFG